MKPTKAEIAAFVQVFDLLSSFEAQQRQFRARGLFKEGDLPIPAIVTVLAWLRAEATE